MKKGKDPLRTEAAIKRALQSLRKGRAYRWHSNLKWYEVGFKDRDTEEYIAIADLRDCHRKRAPIRMKDLRKAIQPRRKRK